LSKKKQTAKRPPEGLVLDCSIVMAWYFADGGKTGVGSISGD
jgi:hypothetical protein